MNITLSWKKGVEVKKGKLFFKVNKKESVNGESFVLTGSEARKLGLLVYIVITSMIKPIIPLRNYFNDIFKILSHLNQPIYWFTPAGMKVYTAPIKYTTMKTRTSLLKSSKPVTIKIPTNQYNYDKMKRSFMANLIHSLDASNIHLLIDLMEIYDVKLNLYTIHDCFVSTSGKWRLWKNLLNVRLLIYILIVIT